MSGPSSRVWLGVGLTEIGRVRKLNQDAFALENPHQLWVLADGMGGHADGEIASKIAVEHIPQFFRTYLGSDISTPLPSAKLEEVIELAIEDANQAIRNEANNNALLQGMGTTIVVVGITSTSTGYQAVLGHAGDSRTYVLRKGALSLWTKDHTLMEERLALNLITPEQASTHPLRHVLTKALGIDPKTHPTIHTYPLEPTDLLLLCSDGLTKMMRDQEIETIMAKEAPHLKQIGTSLVTTANRLGGEDNTTVVVIGLDEGYASVDETGQIEHS